MCLQGFDRLTEPARRDENLNCGLQYSPLASAWEDICGVCIAARIEMALMPGGLSHAVRKPLKRTSEHSAGLHDFEVQALRCCADG
jgi:hypothetical protein